ncbi:MAG: hypothetical protein ACWA41_09795 [Putridiphycobacter sp.]
MKKTIGLLGLALLSIVACQKEDSSDVNQDKIYCDYELFYNKNSDKTHAVAKFKFGGPTGTILELTDSTSASVTFNGDVLPYEPLYAGHHKEYAGKLTTGTFVYTNTEGTVFTNTVPTGDTIAFPAGFDTITKSSAQTLTWVGNALVANERASFYIGTPSWGEDALFSQDDLGATDMVLGVTQKSNLTLGSATLVMDRVMATDITEGTSEGGRIRYRYRGSNVSGAVVN